MRLNPELLIKDGGISKMRKILLFTLAAAFQLLSFQVVNAGIKLVNPEKPVMGQVSLGLCMPLILTKEADCL